MARSDLVSSIAAALVVFIVGNVVWLAIDLDSDGSRPLSEFSESTDPTIGDTDHDGLEDGWETSRGLVPLHPDQDLDGLRDGDDVRRGGLATSSDTDQDGIADVDEVLSDCNADGINAIADADDDADARIDGLENAGTRCSPDTDEDGLLDGEERAEACIRSADCDEDGLLDVHENGTDFDPLDPDTFDTRLSDSVLWAFREKGQQPSGDQDLDGIPDAWETTTGLIEWGSFRPSADRPDLLVEIVRVSGPDSRRFDDISFHSAYQQIASAFLSQGGITLSYIETRVELGSEPRPPSLPSRLSAYYEDILERAVYATNPYVTTLVLNPQHDQSEVLHLGVAPIRGMLAAVDYGAHARYNFQGTRFDQQGNRVIQTNLTLAMSPFIESIIAADRQDAIQATGFASSTVLSDGKYRLSASDYRLEWQPLWFRTAPFVTWNDGKTAQLSTSSRSIDLGEFASTIMHELGHTLGLCHLELADCYATLAANERTRIADSTMGPGHASDTLFFFPSEWQRAKEYVACPPDRPLVLIAQNANETEVLDQKYGYELEDILNVNLRRCGEFPPVPGERFAPVADAFRYQAAPEDRDPDVPSEGRMATVLYALSVLLLTAGAAFVPRIIRP